MATREITVEISPSELIELAAGKLSYWSITTMGYRVRIKRGFDGCLNPKDHTMAAAAAHDTFSHVRAAMVFARMEEGQT